ncbi:glutamate receptor ionotropic, kainate 1 isoform X2 [Drosophila ficusphila]|uniref:glutamate receptor ionotropic, kainate 1 isoform X2 n=1 Tax=Drosophila ficusphila TaxID=30025 RepID=UPI0007E7F8B0|nr:glutamate receptor ionotropic, kainate 1 isoform X2 [Drosophila ficusphila]
MSAVQFLLLAALISSSGANEDVLVVKIGAIFFDTEMKLAEAFSLAVEEVNALNPALRLEPIKHYLTIDDSIVLQDLCCDLIGNGVAAIFGPSSKTNSDIVEVLCNVTGIPHLQFDWHSQPTPRELLNHQLTVNVAPMELFLSAAFSDILGSESFSWKSFTIAYEKSAHLSRLQHILALKQLHKTGIKMQEFERGGDYRILWKRINNAREKFVLLDCPSDILVDVINASIEFNMTGSFNHLFLTNLDTHISGVDRFYSPEFTVSVAAVRIRTYIPPPIHDEKDVFSEDADNMFLSLGTQLLYDSVVLFYNALSEISQRPGFYMPQFSCGRGFWQPGPHLVEQMKQNAQIGICDLTITQARRSVVDFTVPFMQLGISILSYKEVPPSPNIYAFLNPYGVEVWLYVMIAMMITALALVLTGRMDQYEWEQPVENEDHDLEQENTWHLHNSMWLVLGSILNQGCDLLPRGWPMRLLTASWWIFALLISQTYIAKLASFITSSKMENSINSLHDLVDQNKVQFGTVRGGATSVYFSESNDTENRMAWNKMLSFKPDAFTKSNEEGVERVKHSKGRYAFLMETTNLQYYVERNKDLTQIGESFGEKHYGIAVPLNAEFRSNLSVGILKLSEKGVLYRLRKKWFTCNNTASGSDQTDTQSDQFTMDSVKGLFVVLILGVVFAFFIGVAEFMWHVQRISVKEKIPPMLALKAEFIFFVRFWLTKKPIHSYRQSRDSTSTGYSSLGPNSSASTAKKKKKSQRAEDYSH